LSIPQSKPITIPLIIRGNAKAGTDYQVLPTNVTIPAGSMSVSLPLTPLTGATAGRVVVVEANHSDSRSYLLGPTYCAMITLTSP
jgi:hypothetical protein